MPPLPILSGQANVVVDLCTACRMIWLDHGELGAIVSAPGRDRTR
jgi:Zn-finger nucleic acid-binding protein